jgi:hypothetical protein
LMQHLSECGECRELVMLAFPHDQLEGAINSADSRFPLRSLFGWRVLRWGALAALGLVVVGVVLYQPLRELNSPLNNKNVAELAPPVSRQLPASPATASPAGSAAASPGVQSGTQEVRVSPKHRGSAAAKRPVTPDATRHSLSAGGQESQKSDLAIMAPGESEEGSQAAAPPEVAATPPVPLTARDAQAGLMMAKAPQQPRAKAQRLDRAQVTVSGVARQAGQAQPAARPAPQVQSSGRAAAESARDRSQSNGVITSQPIAVLAVPRARGLVQTPSVGETPTALAPKARRASSRTPLATELSTLVKPRAAPAPSRGEWTALWSITSADTKSAVAQAGQASTSNSSFGRFSGRVERSFDGGKTWEVLHVDDSASFRAVYASGPEVWAGGSGGVLYHSADAGSHWTRVPLASGSGESIGAITEIDFSDSQHGKVKTEGGEEWLTSNAGRHWVQQ